MWVDEVDELVASLEKVFQGRIGKSICGNLVAAGEDPGHNLPAGPALHVVLPHRRRHPQTQVLLYRHILQLQPRAGLHLHLGVTVNPKVTLGRLLVQPLSGLPAFASLVH